MMRFFEILSFLLAWGYTAVFFLILKSFLPLRKNVVLKVIAFLVCGYLADSIIYSNDAGSLFGTMLLFFLYVLLFYRGTFMEKLSVMLVFYPALIAINYLMLDTGGRLFKIITQASYEETLQSPTLMLISTAIYTVSLLLRLLFWIGAWLVLRRFLEKIPSHLNIKTWLIIDMLILASFVAIFTIIYFMPENTAIVYPICGASIFSSFGCMYLAAYIYDSMQTAYRVQQMETQRDYYKERIAEEERVRSIYHDLKNHLLVMESRQNTAETRQMAETLRSQIADYEDYVHTGNEFLDIILKDKAAKAREKQIDFSALVDFKGMDFMCNRYKAPSKPEEEISIETIKKLPKMYFTNITGGEPFIRTDLKDIVRELYKKPWRIGTINRASQSDGRLHTDADTLYFSQIKSAACFFIFITISGWSQASCSFSRKSFTSDFLKINALSSTTSAHSGISETKQQLP